MKEDEVTEKDEVIETISELVENASIFDSRGYSIVKVTKDGIEKKIKLPIKSTGVKEYQDELSGKAPKPPATKEFIKKGSPEGKALGIPHDQIAIVFDTTDEAYVDALNAFNQEFYWRVALFALDVSWTKSDGTAANTYEEKKKVLQSNGVTFYQIRRICNDVDSLTQFAEDRQDFLSGS